MAEALSEIAEKRGQAPEAILTHALALYRHLSRAEANGDFLAVLDGAGAVVEAVVLDPATADRANRTIRRMTVADDEAPGPPS